jgi:hypothetical protein
VRCRAGQKREEKRDSSGTLAIGTPGQDKVLKVVQDKVQDKV